MELTRMMSGFRLADSLVEKLRAVCRARNMPLSEAYAAALKMWLDAQERGGVTGGMSGGVNSGVTGGMSGGVRAQDAVRKSTGGLEKPLVPGLVRPPPPWKVYGFKHGLAHREAVAGGWFPGQLVPSDLAAAEKVETKLEDVC